jgi:hypothetical protein
MTTQARQAALGGPSAVAIHDDPDMQFVVQFGDAVTLHCKVSD